MTLYGLDRCLRWLSPVLLVAASVPALAVLDIADTPLSLATGVAPNILLAIDDSGSMDSEVLMPTNDGALWWHTGDESFVGRDAVDAHVGGGVINVNQTGGANNTWKKYTYLFPNGTGSGKRVYGDSTHNHYAIPPIPAFAYTRSPDYNKAYFNPADRYVPWPSVGSASYGNINPESAPSDPAKGSYNFDLTQDINIGDSNFKFMFYPGMPLPGGGSLEGSDKSAKKVRYYPATFYLKDPLPVAFGYTGSTTTGYAPDGSTELYGYEIKSANFSTAAAYEAMMQNFANWFSYYRKRHLATRAGVASSFFEVKNARVGEFTINSRVDVSMRTLSDSGERGSFFDQVYSRGGNSAGTPNRRALDHAGKQFQRSGSGAPITHACQANATILFTDGFSNPDTISGVDNEDGGMGAPYEDDVSSTIADVAMKYYDNHLRTDLATGKVPVDEACSRNDRPRALDCKTDLHMLTYAVTLGTRGLLFDPDNPGDPYANPPSWHESFEARSPTAIDDLWHATINGRGALLNADKPVEIAEKLKSAVTQILQSVGSSSAIATNSTRLDTDTLVFQARYDSRDWSGQLLAYEVAADGSLASLEWDTHSNNGIAAHGSRNILTWTLVSSAWRAVEFKWSELDVAQQLKLTGDVALAERPTVGERRVDWLRGDQSREGTDSAFRVRSQLLGDIVNSNPYFHSHQDYGFSRLPGAEGSSYAAYVEAKAAEPPMIYVGANDGMLHGFDARNGREKFAYVPYGVYDKLRKLVKPDYEHEYFVDGSPRVLDAYWAGAWRSVLVAATGAGGGSVFAIDVSDPDSVGTGDVLWDFHTSAADSDKLGVAMSDPVIARLASGAWVAIFGNGYNSGDTVKLMVVNLRTGALIEAIDTGVSGSDNGLGDVVPVDTNNDRITDFVYAGDLAGNVWKFDLTGNNSNQWAVAFSQGNTPKPLFTAKDADGNAQPITGRITVGRHPDGGVMVYFGTGKYFEKGDSVVGDSPQLQSFYGIRDNGSQVSGRDELVAQSITYEGMVTLGDASRSEFPIRVVSDNSVDYSAKHGWHLALQSPAAANGAGERVIAQPILRYGRIIFPTVIPSADPCNFGGSSWLMELDAITGGRLSYTVFDANGDGLITDADLASINDVLIPPSGKLFDELITQPGIIGAGEKEYKYTSGSRGGISVTTERGNADELGRQSWWQLR